MNQTTAAKTLSAELLANLGVSPRSRKAGSVANTLDTLARRARNGEFDYSVYHAAYGIAYADATARTSGFASLALRKLTTVEVVRLVADIAVQNLSGNEVARYLNTRYAKAA